MAARKVKTAAKSKVFVSETDCYLFGKGTHYEIYKKNKLIQLIELCKK